MCSARATLHFQNWLHVSLKFRSSICANLVYNNALPQFDNVASEALELCDLYQIGVRASMVNNLVDSSSYDRAVLNLQSGQNPGNAAAVNNQSAATTSNSGLYCSSSSLCLCHL